MIAPLVLRSFRIVAVVVVFVATGVALRPVRSRAQGPFGGEAGGAGGLRALAADCVWLEANLVWERRDAVATDRLVRLATDLDPRPLVFWLNGARALGYDLPEWELANGGGEARIGGPAAQAIRARHAENAIALLKAARTAHPASPALEIEIAQLHLVRRHDVVAAADHFRRAAELPGAPYHAGRIYAELLVELGRRDEALAWLRKIHAGLPANEPAALRDEVGRRIEELARRRPAGSR